MFKRLNDLYNLSKRAHNHPLTKGSLRSAAVRFLKWQIASKLMRSSILVPFISDTRLLINATISGSPGDFYFGVNEIEEIAFALHFLRSGDLFGDVGANTGSWTVAAAGVRGTRTISIEPSPDAFSILLDNIAINRINGIVQPMAIGAGAEAARLRLSEGSGSTNRIVTDGSGLEGAILPLNKVFTEIPLMLKIDVEGFEPAVIRGADGLIRQDELKAIIVEDEGLFEKYKFESGHVDKTLRASGFESYQYIYGSRMLKQAAPRRGGNTIYLRDLNFIEKRTSAAEPFTVLGRLI